jgi:Fur family ferric uptake transcriptional regulator
MGSQLIQFEQRLRQRGLRMTPGRRAILDYAVRHLGHFDAEELLDTLRHDGVSVSRATVYRTLGHLVEMGLLRRHPMGDRGAFYEGSLGREHHEHLVCVECGAILEFVQKEIEKLQEEVCREHGFQPLRHTLQIYGLCEKCQSDADASDLPARPETSAGATGTRG